MSRTLTRLLSTLSLILLFGGLKSQCPQFYDRTEDFSSTPIWTNCTPTDYTLNIVPNVDMGAYTIDWGDGQTSAGASVPANGSVTHFYPATQGNYTITITSNGCTVTGLLVLELPVKASIEVPPGGVTQICAPGSLDFLNNSTGNSINTTYYWTFGDGTNSGVLDHTDNQQTQTHQYERGTVTCETVVTLYAENYCTTTPSIATFSPVQIWDLDLPAISASNTLLCYPDTIVTFTNTTYRNCALPSEGNTSQRFEHWRFIDYFGPGQDSIIDWRPWPPTTPRTIAYPGLGTYCVELMDSSFCGIVSITQCIDIINPPIADLTQDKDTICLGEEVTFTRLTDIPANVFRWNADEGNGWRNFNGTSQSVVYNTTGDKDIIFAVDVNGGTPSCKDSIVLNVHVLDDPIAQFNTSKKKDCDQLNAVFSDNSTDAFQWEWDFGNGQTSTNQNPTVVNYTGAGEYYIELTVTSANDCKATARDTVQVITSPQVSFSAPNVCVNEEFTLSNTSVLDDQDSVITWNWDFGNGVTAKGKEPTHVYLTAGSYQITLKADSGFCDGSKTNTILVNPKPVAAFTPNPTIGCSPLDVTFQNQTTGAQNFTWNFGDGQTSNAANPTHNYDYSGAVSQEYMARLYAVSNKGCLDSSQKVITVHPNINADFSFESTNNCTEVSTQFTSLSQGATNFQWDFGDGGKSTRENPKHAYVNSGSFTTTYTVTFIASNDFGCSDTIIKDISITPQALFGFTATPDSGCSPSTIFFTAKPGAANYEWEFHDGTTVTSPTATKTYINNTTTFAKYKVKLTATTFDGCIDIQESEIVVYPNPKAAFTLTPLAGCSPLEVTLNNSSVGAVGAQWNYGDGTQSDTNVAIHKKVFTNYGNNDEVYTIQLIAVSQYGCTDTVEKTVTVFPGINAQFTDSIGGCSPLVNTFQASGGVSYSWDFGNGQLSAQPSETVTFLNNDPANAKKYNVKLIATSANGCNDTVSGIVHVHPKPIAQYTANNNAGCSPFNVVFTDQSIGATTWLWQMPDGQVQGSSGGLTYDLINNTSTSEIYQTELIAGNSFGCTDTFRLPIEVYPKVIANSVFNNDGCSPFPVKFFNLSENANSYKWDFGIYGITNDEAPTITFQNNQNAQASYPFELVAYSIYGCTDTLREQVFLNPNPIADFSLDNNFGCEPFNVQVQNNSVGSVDHYWDFGNASPGINNNVNFTHTYENPTTLSQSYDIVLVATNSFGCKDTTIKPVDVYPRVTPKFDPIPNSCEPYTVDVIDRSEGATNIIWNFNNESTSNAPSTAYTFTLNNGTQNAPKWVELIAINSFGCRDTLRHNFTLYAKPEAQFAADPITMRYPDDRVSLLNTTQGNWTYFWDFGDGLVSNEEQPNSHTYNTWGEYTINLIANNSFCSDTTQQTITITPPLPVADFNGAGIGCVPLTVHFNNTSDFNVSNFWDFGDGLTSTDENPSHTYFEVGTYSVSLTVEGPAGDLDSYTLVNVVEVNENAIAGFTMNPTEVNARTEPVDFLNLSQRADTYEWDFGDGNFSEEENPTHFYQQAGVYDIELIANNRFNCPDTFLLQNAVNVVTGGVVSFPNAFSPNTSGPSDGRYNPSDISNDIFFPIYKEVRTFHLQIFTRWGELIFESHDVEIGWDGYLNGVLCQQEVYVYRAEGVFEDGTPYNEFGDVTLLR